MDVVRLADGFSVFTSTRTVPPETPQTLRWNGRTATGLALDGRYELRIAVGTAAAASSTTSAVAGGAAPVSAPPPPGSARVGAFTFVGAVFPVRGDHDYGESAARFGAGRAGHRHEGQDVMADCGTPLVAARGGVVGETGDATACHLHFEIWTAPGWYAGGAPIDPLETLQAWDRLS